eukprot:465409-Prymnesium_polylepis.3
MANCDAGKPIVVRSTPSCSRLPSMPTKMSVTAARAARLDAAAIDEVEQSVSDSQPAAKLGRAPNEAILARMPSSEGADDGQGARPRQWERSVSICQDHDALSSGNQRQLPVLRRVECARADVAEGHERWSVEGPDAEALDEHSRER